MKVSLCEFSQRNYSLRFRFPPWWINLGRTISVRFFCSTLSRRRSSRTHAAAERQEQCREEEEPQKRKTDEKSLVTEREESVRPSARLENTKKLRTPRRRTRKVAKGVSSVRLQRGAYHPIETGGDLLTAAHNGLHN